jgi:hypothetical protein
MFTRVVAQKADSFANISELVLDNYPKRMSEYTVINLSSW